MVSLYVYTVLIVATAIERLVEVRVSNRNAAWAFARGGQEFGKPHFKFMVILHTLFLIGCVVEPWLLQRSFESWGYLFLFVAILCQSLRWWVITTLGHRWNTRVIVVPGLTRITGGPFKYFPHPNYLAVVVEGIALPMIHGAWITALIFSVLNAGLLAVRIRCEDDALDWAAESGADSSPNTMEAA